MLNEHLNYLSLNDNNFKKYIKSISSLKKNEFFNSMKIINEYKNNSPQTIKNEILESHELIKRIFIRVPHITQTLYKLPKNWNSFIKSSNKKNELFKDSKIILENFLKKYDLSNSSFLYGNIKSDFSLEQKIKADYLPKNSKSIRDIWDIVRFRIVSNNYIDTMIISNALWDEYFDKIVKCSNYFCYPKSGNPLNSYRGLHFEIEIDNKKIIEIQVITKQANYNSYIDHSISFKKTIKFINNEHQEWLNLFLLKSTLYEYNQLIKNKKIKLPLTPYKKNCS